MSWRAIGYVLLTLLDVGAFAVGYWVARSFGLDPTVATGAAVVIAISPVVRP